MTGRTITAAPVWRRRKAGAKLPALRERWPRQLQTMAAQLDRLNALESAGSHDLDALCNAFWRTAGRGVRLPRRIWAPALRGMGQWGWGAVHLPDGRLRRSGKGQPPRAVQRPAAAGGRAAPAAYEQRCHELLTQQMGRCAQQFEMLPILKDTPEGKLLYNTIYSGVWSKYALVRKHREAKRHD